MTGVWLGLLAVPAGVLGTCAAFLGASLLKVGMTAAGGDPWRAGLAMFPLMVVSLLLAVTLHIGLVGTLFSEQTREWWGRVGGLVMLLTALWTGLELVTLYGPHAFEWLGGWAGRHKELVKSALAALWAVITGAGVYAGHSNRTGPAGGSRWLDRLGRLAPPVFVLGYLLILANVVHKVVPIPGAEDLHCLEEWLHSRAAGADAWPALDRANPTSEALRHTMLLPNAVGATLAHSAGRGLLLAASLAGVLAYFLSRRVGANEFSLHALYRNRLVRCYLGASNPKRSAHPFTGFDPPTISSSPGSMPPIRPAAAANPARSGRIRSSTPRSTSSAARTSPGSSARPRRSSSRPTTAASSTASTNSAIPAPRRTMPTCRA